MSHAASSADAFLDSYRGAFERFHAPAIADHFAYPCHVTSDTGEIVLTPVTTQDDWTGQIEQLLSTYRRTGVSAARILERRVTELSPRLLQAVVHWALYDSAGGLLYRFEAAYTLAHVGGALRITALAHNELPKLQARLAERSS